MNALVHFVMDHPALLLLLLPAVPSVLVKLEKAALAELFSLGDAADQAFARDVAAALVKWAEAKYDAPGSGDAKRAAVDRALAWALPFMSADQRKDLIEKSVAELDKGAKEVIAAAPPAPPAA
jgi:hypothetical protein